MALATAALSFGGMTDLGIDRGLDLQFQIIDRTTDLYMCVGRSDNRVRITGTTPLSRQAPVLAAIDQFGKWGETVPLWMVTYKGGVLSAQSRPVSYQTPVKPFYGRLKISDIAADIPRLTYPGNGMGRLLSKAINGRYYFVYGGKLETASAMRGFDCTSFPMALLSIPNLPSPGYGRQLCEAAHAEQCDMEQLKRADLEARFKSNSIPNGVYVLFSEGHVPLYNSDVNTLHEFTHGGYQSHAGFGAAYACCARFVVDAQTERESSHTFCLEGARALNRQASRPQKAALVAAYYLTPPTFRALDVGGYASADVGRCLKLANLAARDRNAHRAASHQRLTRTAAAVDKGSRSGPAVTQRTWFWPLTGRSGPALLPPHAQ